MTPDYHGMLMSFLAFTVLPLVVVGVSALVVKARARGRRLFRDEPWDRIDHLRPMVIPDHRQDIV